MVHQGMVIPERTQVIVEVIVEAIATEAFPLGLEGFQSERAG
jgi:hypothetical protein